jgi:hypothetical protein
MTPVKWSELDPKLTAAIVEAQGLAESVPVDSQHGQGYKYASLSAIVSCGRAAMTASGLAMVTDGWSVDGSTLQVDCVIVHKDGPCSPVISAVMPIANRGDPTKALSASLSTARKYMLAGILNMDWTDPSTDTDSVHGPSADRQRANRQHAHPAAAPPQRSQDPGAYESLLTDARGWARRLMSLGIDKNYILPYATGLDGAIPQQPATSILRAICTAGKVLSAAKTTEGGIPPDSHEMLVTAIAQSNVPVLWSHGKITPTGESVDKSHPIDR